MSNRTTRLATFVAVLALAIGMLGTGTAFAQYPPPEPTPSPTEEPREEIILGRPGATIEIRGNNWAEAEVTITRRRLSQQSAGEDDDVVFRAPARVDESGALRTAVDLPSDLEPGDYEVVIEGQGTAGEPKAERQVLAVQSSASLNNGLGGGGFTNLHLLLTVVAVGAGGSALVLRRRIN